MVVEAVDVTVTAYELCVKLGRGPLAGPPPASFKE